MPHLQARQAGMLSPIVHYVHTLARVPARVATTRLCALRPRPLGAARVRWRTAGPAGSSSDHGEGLPA